jgi:hypothetical protein
VRDEESLAGPGELHRPFGTYGTFLAAMQRGAKQRPQLATLNLHVAEDLSNALMSGWARVCDVLGFYQNRIANEGYLTTAIEPASIVWLAAQIGERREPAIGAQTHLALQLIDASGQPESLFVNPGPSLAVQNAPASPEALPVVFECAERRELKPVWNALAPVVAPVVTPARIWSGCRSVRLVGTSLGIRPGGGLLLAVAAGRAWLAIADTVQVDRTFGCTMVTWRDPVPPIDDPSPPAIVEVTQFERSAGLFGRTAMAWADVPDKQKQAIGVRPGGVMALDQDRLTPNPPTPGPDVWTCLPGAASVPANIQALIGLGGEGLLAGTDRGLVRSTDGGATWQTLALPQPKGWHDILSLHRDDSGTLYAGTAAGVVLTSGDGGDGWAMMTQRVIPGAGEKPGMLLNFLEDIHVRERPKPHAPWMLASPIHAIVTRTTTTGGAPEIYIGTDRGVFAMAGDRPGWQPFNGQLPGAGNDGSADVSVAALAIIPAAERSPASMVAATNRGLFMADLPGSAWSGMDSGQLSPPECTSLALTPGPEGVQIFVGTSAGIFWIPALDAWYLFNEGLGDTPPPVASLLLVGNSLYAATADGLYESPIAAPVWIALGQDLTLFEMDELFAGGLDAGKVSTALSQRFARFGIALDPKATVRSLYAPAGPRAPPGPRLAWELDEPDAPKRTFRIYAETPLRVTQLIGGQSCPGGRLATFGSGIPVASVPVGPVLNAEWPDFAIATGEVTGDAGVDGAEIYLDREIDGIEDGSFLVLAAAGSSLADRPEIHSVIASESILHKAYGRQGIVTRIVVKPTAALLAADLRTTNVYLISRSVAPFAATDSSLEPLTGTMLALPGVHGDLAPGRSLQVSGPRPGAVILPTAAMDRVVAQVSGDSAPLLDCGEISPQLRTALQAAGIALSPAAWAVVVTQGSAWLIADPPSVWPVERTGAAAEALPLTVYAPADQEGRVASADTDCAPALDQQMIAPGLKSAFAAAGIKLSPSASVEIFNPGTYWLIRDGDRVWRLRLTDARVGPQRIDIHETTLLELIARPEDRSTPPDQDAPWIFRCGDEVLKRWLGKVICQRAASTQASHSEIVTIESVSTDAVANVTTVTLAAPLRNLYDGALCRVCANVVLATQGETVQGEVLGSGQPAAAGQSFTLHRAPLTYTRDADWYHVHCDLEVRVNGDGGRALCFGGGMAPTAPKGELWTRVPSLALAGPADRVYALTADDSGRTTLYFGDGVHGARLPSGGNNVSASYRAGAGAAGNVRAGSLIALRKRPAGIRSVTNPAAATGGADAETVEGLRRRAPRKFHFSQRIVTLSDYEEFAEAQTGVGRASAFLVEEDILLLTVATSNWRPISHAPRLKKLLETTVRAARADQLRLELVDPTLVSFDASLDIGIRSGFAAAEVCRRVRQALERAFGPAMRGFGEAVDPQAIENAASAVPGVATVRLTALYRTGYPPGEIAPIEAGGPHRDPKTGALISFDWLVINASEGISVVSHD